MALGPTTLSGNVGNVGNVGDAGDGKFDSSSDSGVETDCDSDRELDDDALRGVCCRS